MSTLSANTLFHFTRTRETLISILKSGFYPRLSLEENFFFSKNNTKIAYPMVCFCDIPLSQIKNHTDSYGKYAIGLKKDWAKEKGISPVLYTHKDSFITKNLIENFKNVWEAIENSPTNVKLSKLWEDLIYNSFFIKPYEGVIKIGTSCKLINFYNEREWRYILPKDKIIYLLNKELDNTHPNKAFLEEHDFNNKSLVDKINKINESNGLTFDLKDINYIIVEKESDILPLINDLTTIGSKYSYEDVQILTTRIISMERISEDF